MIVSNRTKEEKKRVITCHYLEQICKTEFKKNGWSGKVNVLANKAEDMGCAFAMGIDWPDFGQGIPADSITHPNEM